jgi:hypothetical protein
MSVSGTVSRTPESRLMAQRKSTPSGKSASGRATNASGNPTRPGSKAAAAKAGAGSASSSTTTGNPSSEETPAAKTPVTKVTGTKPTGAKARPAGKSTNRPGGPKGPAQRPPARRKKKSIVNQKQTPWGLIASAVAVVVFAAAVVIVVVATHKSGPTYAAVTHGGQTVKASDPYRQQELPAAKAIKDISYTVEAQHTHIEGHIKYDSSPPVGGDHSQYWADCTGTVYPKAIANENAVHMLEHGAVWITYNASTLPASQLAILKKDVSGVDRMALSPYPNLKTPISLQSWGYQLFVQKATDPRVAEFIKTLKYNSKTTPEPGATCSQPTFKNHPSTFGHPLWVPANGSSGNVGGV